MPASFPKVFEVGYKKQNKNSKTKQKGRHSVISPLYKALKLMPPRK